MAITIIGRVSNVWMDSIALRWDSSIIMKYVARGVLDTRNVIYMLSIALFFSYVTTLR
jgi:hypothetical protein